MKIQAAVREYLNAKVDRCKMSSITQAHFHLGKFCQLSSVGELHEVTPAVIDKVVAEMRGLAPASINGTLRQLRAFLRWCEERHMYYGSTNIKLLREGRKLPTALSPEEVDRLMLRATTYEVMAAIALAAYAGLRHGEIRHLRRVDVDLYAGVVRITAKDCWSPKSHAEREVPINEKLRRRLAAYVVENEKSPDAWLFPRCLRAEIKAVFKRAGLSDPAIKPGLHLLRRTFASQLLANGVDIETVRELGGWADLKTVQRYLASTTERKRAAVAALED